MELKEKLIELFSVIIENVTDVSQVNGGNKIVDVMINSQKHSITIFSGYSNLLNRVKLHTINFGDLSAELHESEYIELKRKLSECYNKFSEKEMDKKRKQQERLVDELLKIPRKQP